MQRREGLKGKFREGELEEGAMMAGMSEMMRRDVLMGLAALAAMAAVGEGQETAASKLLPKGGEFPTETSRVFRFGEMPVTANENGGWGRAVIHGTLPTGEYVECHETMLPAGKMPHPPHRHPNTEFILVRQGKLEYLDDGKALPVIGPGDVIFTASNVMHGLKNVGETEALYFVVSVGKQG
jgi:quercetin dioxygenase-like cupin family protein